jgi:hypothetical protein
LIYNIQKISIRHPSPDIDPRLIFHNALPRLTMRSSVQPVDPSIAISQVDQASQRTPRVSILMTLTFHRGRIHESIQSWLENETLQRNDIELILLSNGLNRPLEKAVTAHLLPDERLIHVPSRNEMELYSAGARHARGEWLLFTEPHCIASRNCLETLLTRLTDASLDGGCVQTLPSQEQQWVAQIEARMYLEDARIWTQEGDWRKFTKRGFLLRRASYEAVRGLEHRYGCFAEMILAARLHRHGCRIGFVPEAAITHYNSPKLHELLDYVQEYRRQECAFHDDHPDIIPDGLPRVGKTGAQRLTPQQRKFTSVAVKHALLKNLRPPFQPWRLTGILLHQLWQLHQSGNASLVLSKLRCLLAWAKLHFPGMPVPKRYEAFQRLWQLMGDTAVLDYRKSRPEPAAPMDSISGATPFHPGDCGENALFGFHEREVLEGRSFRWTAPVACLAVVQKRCALNIAVEIQHIRTIQSGEAALYWNDIPATPLTNPSRPGWLTFQVSPEAFVSDGPQWLTLQSTPLKNRQDHRPLGLPIFTIEFTQATRSNDNT